MKLRIVALSCVISLSAFAATPFYINALTTQVIDKLKKARAVALQQPPSAASPASATSTQPQSTAAAGASHTASSPKTEPQVTTRTPSNSVDTQSPAPSGANERASTTASSKRKNRASQLRGTWAGTNASFGGVMNTGTQQSSSMNGGLNLQYVKAKWTYLGVGNYQKSQSESKGVTANRLSLNGNVMYSFSEKHFFYTQLNYLNDSFNGYDYTIDFNIGYGRHLDLGPTMDLDLFTGPGARYAIPEGGVASTYPSYQIGGRYTWIINDQSQLSEVLQVTTASNDTFTSSQTNLSTNITQNLAFQVGFLITEDSKPIQDAQPINTTTTVQLVYNFV